MISAEFFYAREKKIKEYQAKGYQELRATLDEQEIETLINAKLLKLKAFYVTCEMYEFNLALKGKEYLRELKTMDIILIKPNKEKALRGYITSEG